MNFIIEIAKKHNRDYITPEDISDALRSHNRDTVRMDTLEVLSGASGFGAEDHGLCAFIAWKGES